MENGSEIIYAKLTVKNGILNHDQLKECLIEQELLSQKGESKSLANIIKDKSFATDAQLETLANQLKEETLAEDMKSNSNDPIVEKNLIEGYEILEKLGSGTFGIVYKAKQLAFDRIVALKVLPSKFAKNDQYRENFLSEAKVAVKLSHDNIVDPYDIAQSGGLYYFSMEYVEGETISQKLESLKVLDEKFSVNIVKQIAEGLAYSNQKKLIHKDIRPNNIIVTSTGIAKLCDLGLAKQIDVEPILTSDQKQVNLPLYVSPEQIKGLKLIDIRSDIYSLGATLFHMVCGAPPYVGATSAIITAKHTTEPIPDPRHRKSTISEGASYIIRKMLSKEPIDRYQNPDELIEDIKNYEKGELHIAELVSKAGVTKSAAIAPKAISKPKTAKTPKNDLIPDSQSETQPVNKNDVQELKTENKTLKTSEKISQPQTPKTVQKTKTSKLDKTGTRKIQPTQPSIQAATPKKTDTRKKRLNQKRNQLDGVKKQNSNMGVTLGIIAAILIGVIIFMLIQSDSQELAPITYEDTDSNEENLPTNINNETNSNADTEIDSPEKMPDEPETPANKPKDEIKSDPTELEKKAIENNIATNKSIAENMLVQARKAIFNRNYATGIGIYSKVVKTDDFNKFVPEIVKIAAEEMDKAQKSAETAAQNEIDAINEEISKRKYLTSEKPNFVKVIAAWEAFKPELRLTQIYQKKVISTDGIISKIQNAVIEYLVDFELRINGFVSANNFNQAVSELEFSKETLPSNCYKKINEMLKYVKESRTKHQKELKIAEEKMLKEAPAAYEVFSKDFIELINRKELNKAFKMCSEALMDKRYILDSNVKSKILADKKLVTDTQYFYNLVYGLLFQMDETNTVATLNFNIKGRDYQFFVKINNVKEIEENLTLIDEKNIEFDYIQSQSADKEGKPRKLKFTDLKPILFDGFLKWYRSNSPEAEDLLQDGLRLAAFYTINLPTYPVPDNQDIADAQYVAFREIEKIEKQGETTKIHWYILDTVNTRLEKPVQKLYENTERLFNKWQKMSDAKKAQAGEVALKYATELVEYYYKTKFLTENDGERLQTINSWINELGK